MSFRKCVSLSLTLLASSAPALADISSAISTPTSASASRSFVVESVSGCPNRSGTLNSITVPVSEAANFIITTTSPASKTATFRVTADDPAILAVGNSRQGYTQDVVVPIGASQSDEFTLFGKKVGKTTFRATSLTSGFTGFSIPVGAWDVGPDGRMTKFLDPNPAKRHCRNNDSSYTFSTTESTLSNCGEPALGVVTDGVSRLLMRTRSGLSGTACYEIVSSGSWNHGEILTAVKSTSTVNGIAQASSYYQAPDGFDDTSNAYIFHPVEIEFTFTPSIGNGNTTKIRSKTMLVRPPVALVHGLWGSPADWGSEFLLNDSYRTAIVGDYSATHSSPFSVNSVRIQHFAKEARDASRAKKYSTTQVDVVAHSMGGILTRLYADASEYIRPDNLGHGDVHRLLTIDTPHLGSTFANLLISLHHSRPKEIEETVEFLVNESLTDGAVCDLAENSPALTQYYSGTSLPGHAITATGGPSGYSWSPAPYWLPFETALTREDCVERNWLGYCSRQEPRFPQDIVNAFRFREENDAIVGLPSQAGGLDDFTTTNFSDFLHFAYPGWAGAQFGVASEDKVAGVVRTRLSDPGDSFQWATYFPGSSMFDGTGTPITVPGIGGGIDADTYAAECINGPMATSRDSLAIASDLRQSASASDGDSRLRVIHPPEGAIFEPGNTVDVVVSVDASLDAVDIRVGAPGLGLFTGTAFDGTTYESGFVIPETYAGPLSIVPAITNAAGTIVSGEPLEIAVRSTEPPQIVSVLQRDQRIQVGTNAQLYVFATYPGDIRRDVSTSNAGTAYQTSDPNVVGVDANGRLTAASPGAAVVTASNAGLTDFAIVRVVNGDSPLLPANVTNRVRVERSGFRLNRNTGFFTQTLRVSNDAATPLPGPLYVAVENLPAGVELVNKDGVAQATPASGVPYFALSLLDGLTLPSKTGSELLLQFINPSKRGISYDVQVLRSETAP